MDIDLKSHVILIITLKCFCAVDFFGVMCFLYVHDESVVALLLYTGNISNRNNMICLDSNADGFTL